MPSRTQLCRGQLDLELKLEAVVIPDRVKMPDAIPVAAVSPAPPVAVTTAVNCEPPGPPTMPVTRAEPPDAPTPVPMLTIAVSVAVRPTVPMSMMSFPSAPSTVCAERLVEPTPPILMVSFPVVALSAFEADRMPNWAMGLRKRGALPQ